MAWGYRSLLSRTRSTKVCEKEDESCVVNVCRAGGRTTSYTIQTAEHQGLVYVIGYCLTLNQLYSSAVWAVGRSLRERSNQYMGTLALMSPPSLSSLPGPLYKNISLQSHGLLTACMLRWEGICKRSDICDCANRAVAFEWSTAIESAEKRCLIKHGILMWGLKWTRRGPFNSWCVKMSHQYSVYSSGVY